MKRCGRAMVLALIALAGSANAEWRVESFQDRLVPEKQQPKFAFVIGSPPFEQSGRNVEVRLVISCRNAIGNDGSGEFKQLGAELRFSERVAIGERYIRWRVDANPVELRKMPFYADGTIYFLYAYIGRDALTQQLRKAKVMRVEFDLPWAGAPVVEFDVTGAAEAFAQIPCGAASAKRPHAPVPAKRSPQKGTGPASSGAKAMDKP